MLVCRILKMSRKCRHFVIGPKNFFDIIFMIPSAYKNSKYSLTLYLLFYLWLYLNKLLFRHSPFVC